MVVVGGGGGAGAGEGWSGEAERREERSGGEGRGAERREEGKRIGRVVCCGLLRLGRDSSTPTIAG